MVGRRIKTRLLYNSSVNLYIFSRSIELFRGVEGWIWLFIVTDSYGHFLSFLALEVIGLRETTWRILTFFFKVGKRKRRKTEFKRIIIHEPSRESNLVYEYHVNGHPVHYVINVLLRGDPPSKLLENPFNDNHILKIHLERFYWNCSITPFTNRFFFY